MSVGSISIGQPYSYDVTVQVKKSVAKETTDTTTQTTDTSTQSSFNTPTKWGFKVDSNGFFGIDFNKAAGLPESVKINQKMMEWAEGYSKNIDQSMDSIATMSKAWSSFKTVSGSKLDPHGDGLLTLEDVKALPGTYVSKGNPLDVLSVPKTSGEAEAVGQAWKNVRLASKDTLDNWRTPMYFDGL